jgi:glucan 1,3-beta-glucosidase
MKVAIFAILAANLLSGVLALSLPEGFDPKTKQFKNKRFQTWDYENNKIHGVNLGGWFVLEPYITPSLFKPFAKGGDESQIPVDEYHFCQALGRDQAQSILDNHWDTWYLEQDFANIAKAGLNFVRIPIGYWAWEVFETDPYVLGQVKYLDRALGWCEKYGLNAWIDLHGAAGSQNGFDNSGLRDVVNFQKGNNPDVTLDVLQKIFWKYGNENYANFVIGIELVNEPLGPVLNMDMLKGFYQAGYNNLRSTGSVTPVIIHDAFQPSGYWDNFLTVADGDHYNVVVDHHHYQVFSPGELQRNIDQQIETVCNWGTSSLNEAHWNIVGEWSAALTDCALWLNGVGRGARWSGDYDNCPYIDSCASYINISQWPQDYVNNVRRYIEAQLDAFELRSGWVFWNWKTEDAPEWDMSALIAAGLFPQPLNDRKFPKQCNF